MDPEYAVVLTTCASKDEAETIAGRLVGDRVAACVNVIANVTSVYEWKGKTEQAAETLLVIKTRLALVDGVERTIKRLSSYECPEVLVLPVTAGSAEYLRWMTEVTSPV